MKNINEQLQLLKNENLIWLIYIFISIFAIVSNHFEKQYDLTNDSEAYKKFKTINICIFTIAFFIYLYFFKEKITWILVMAICLFVISIIFIISSFWLKKHKK